MAGIVANEEENIQEILTRGVQDIIEKSHLEAALRKGKRLRVKLGIDPTAAHLHLGHAVVLDKLRQFQVLGHKAVLIIGDFTATIGDPSGRTEARTPLSAADVRRNMAKYLAQAGKVIDLKKTEVRRNSEWHAKKGLAALLELASVASVAQVLKRQDFAKRLENEQDVTLLETLYPLLQGYDSVAVKADVELGGTDQLLNLLMGRRVQRHYGMPEQDVLTVELMEGLDGSKKMSKSVGNTVNILDESADMFGKIMSLPDELIIRWFVLATTLPIRDVETRGRSLAAGEKAMEAKKDLAFEIVKRYRGEKTASLAREKWENIFSRKKISAGDMSELRVGKVMEVLELVMASGIAKSRSEARRYVEQGAVNLNGIVLKNWRHKLVLGGGETLKIGPRRFFRLMI